MPASLPFAPGFLRIRLLMLKLNPVPRISSAAVNKLSAGKTWGQVKPACFFHTIALKWRGTPKSAPQQPANALRAAVPGVLTTA